MAKSTAEDHVRAYLAYLADPKSLIDPEAVRKAQSKADRAKDPVLRVKALSELERAENPDGQALVDAFVECAADWAAAEAVTPQALRTVGVHVDVLTQAGLIASNHTSARPAKAAGKATRKRQATIGIDELEKLVPDGVFTTKDLAATVDRNYQTTRNYVSQLLEAGVIVDLGPDPEWDGRGKAPTRYERAV